MTVYGIEYVICTKVLLIEIYDTKNVRESCVFYKSSHTKSQKDTFHIL